jgi:hypothetical protein
VSDTPADYYGSEDRAEAEEAGYALVQALESLGVALTDTGIVAPCDNCSPRAGYKINLGNISAEDAREMTEKFKTLVPRETAGAGYQKPQV